MSVVRKNDWPESDEGIVKIDLYKPAISNSCSSFHFNDRRIAWTSGANVCFHFTLPFLKLTLIVGRWNVFHITAVQVTFTAASEDFHGNNFCHLFSFRHSLILGPAALVTSFLFVLQHSDCLLSCLPSNLLSGWSTRLESCQVTFCERRLKSAVLKSR